MGKVRTYEGADIEIGFDMGRCIHARNCYLKLPQVFDPSRKPWVAPDAAPAEEIAAMIRTCPSGALTFRRKDGGLAETPGPINRVRILENGPLALEGHLQVQGEEMPRATLCRCGKSGNMPFCDHSHVEAGFTATGEPSTDAKTDGDPEKGTAAADPIENGPLKVVGPIEVISGTGKRLGVMNRAFFCRCGQSGNKPFCDGSHKEAGFEG